MSLPEPANGVLSSLTIPEVLPVLPSNAMVAYPEVAATVAVAEPPLIQLVDEAMRADRLVALAAQRPGPLMLPGYAGLQRVGTACVIHRLLRLPDGSLQLLLQGVERVRLGELVQTEPFWRARIEALPDQPSSGEETEALRRAVLDTFARLTQLLEGLPPEIGHMVESLGEPRQVAYAIAGLLPFPLAARQELLESDPVSAKLRRLLELLQHELSVRELGRKIAAEARGAMSRAEREHFLRLQLEAIRRELGEADDGREVRELRERLAASRLPDAARAEAERELGRLEAITPAALQ